MRRSHALVAVVVLTLLALAGVLVAQDRTPASFGEDLDHLLTQRQATLGELEAAYRAATDEMALLEALRAIDEHKHGTEVAVMTLQLTHAQRKGDQLAIARLELAIETLQTPPASVASEEALAASRQRRAGGRDHD